MPPLGPTNIAIIAKGFKKEINEGVAVGAGAGFADFIYILIAYGGVSLIRSFIPDSVNIFISENELYFKAGITAVGCIIVFYYGLKIMRSKSFPVNKSVTEELTEIEAYASEKLSQKGKEIEKIIKKKPIKQNNGSSIYGSFVAGILLCVSSITLPASWFAFVGYLKSYHLIDNNFLSGLALAIGVMAGTTLWFYTIVKIISANAHKILPSTLNKLNVVVGIFLIILSVFLFYKVFDFAFAI
jgi:threonine/homoserine/homoserine lactone efflux protein